MFRSYLKVAGRSLMRHRGHTLASILGLSLAVAVCLLVAHYVRFERSFDGFHEGSERIFRLVLDEEALTGVTQTAGTPPLLAPELAAFPEVEQAVRFGPANLLVERGDRRYREGAVRWADASFFDVFSFPLRQGDPSTALAAPYSMVLTESAARKYFGEEEALGQTVLVDRTTPYTITGVAADVPAHSHFRFDLLVSTASMEAGSPDWEEALTLPWSYTYVRLASPEDAQRLQARLPGFVDRLLTPVMQERGVRYALSLEPLDRVYLHSERLYPPGPVGSLTDVYVFSLLAAFVLALACVNFANLATARSLERAREIGVRKVMGATRGEVARQFLCEFFLVAAAACVLGVVLSEAALPGFRALVGREALQGIAGAPALLLWLPLMVAGVGLLAGAYPAFILARFRPVLVLKGSFKASRQGLAVRRSLIVFQFALTAGLIAATLVVFRQLEFVRTFDVGFRKEGMLVVNFSGEESVWRRHEAVKQRLAMHPAVMAVTASSDVPSRSRRPAPTQIRNAAGEMQEISMVPYLVDFDFAGAYGLDVRAGRLFSRGMATDSAEAMVINETAARMLGFPSPEAAVGQPFEVWGNTGTVIGVVKDFHFKSLREAVAPMWMRIAPVDFRFLSLRIETADLARTVADVEEIWQRAAPEVPFEHTFLNDRLEGLYERDDQFAGLFAWAAGLAVFLACLGLFSLCSFSIRQRTKEIGVRRVLGASAPSIMRLLVGDMLKLVCAGFALAVPVAYWTMDGWLAGFAYRIDLSPGVFILAGLAALVLAVATVGYRSVRAALADPVKSLKYE